MLDFLDNLRQKPESVRRRIVFTGAAVVTGVIFVIWLSIVTVRLSDVAPPPSELQTTNKSASSFEDVQKEFSQFMEEGRRLLDEQARTLATGTPATKTIGTSTPATEPVESEIIDVTESLP